MNEAEEANSSSALVVEHGETGGKSWTEQTRNTVERVLGSLGNSYEDDDKDDWEDLTPDRVATIDLKVVASNPDEDKANAQGKIPQVDVFGGSNSLLGMIEQLHFESSDPSTAKEDVGMPLDEPMNVSKGTQSESRGATRSTGEDNVTPSEAFHQTLEQEPSATERAIDTIDSITDRVLETVDTGVQAVKDKFNDLASTGQEDAERKDQVIAEMGKDTERKDIGPDVKADDKTAGERKTSESLAETVVAKADADFQAVQDVFEKAKEMGEEAFGKALASVRKDDTAKSSQEPETERPAAGSGEVDDDVVEAMTPNDARVAIGNTPKHRNSEVKPSDQASETIDADDVTSDNNEAGASEEGAFTDHVLEKVDTGIHTVKKQLEQVAKLNDNQSASFNLAEDRVDKDELKEPDKGIFASKSDLLQDASETEGVNEEAARVESGQPELQKPDITKDDTYKEGDTAFDTKTNMDTAAESGTAEGKEAGEPAAVDKSTSSEESGDNPADAEQSESPAARGKKKKNKNRKRKNKLKETHRKVPDLSGDTGVQDQPMVPTRSVSTGALKTPH
ncbi:hypothetical protein MPSEU_000011500 [Mayamaea pseudoterrestris]|nr:hypothetical protein MPSEU_000011500 [Mayamaea pseudoterrestris]